MRGLYAEAFIMSIKLFYFMHKYTKIFFYFVNGYNYLFEVDNNYTAANFKNNYLYNDETMSLPKFSSESFFLLYSKKERHVGKE